MNNDLNIKTSNLLGSPGVYYDQNSDYNCEDEMKKEGFFTYVNSYLMDGIAVGSRKLDIASLELKDFFLNNMKLNLTLFCSHDFLVAAFMRFTGIKFPSKNGFVDYLEGSAFIIDNNNKLEIFRFKHGE